MQEENKQHAQAALSDEHINRIAGRNGIYRAMTPDDQACKSMVKRFVGEVLAASQQPAADHECRHETTVRQGAIWTKCEDCGKRWADDEKPAAAPSAEDMARAIADKLHTEYAPRAIIKVAPEPFILGNQYRTQGGRVVRFIGIANEGTSYETMYDELGHHRYTKRDFGRCTGASWDDDCVPPLYTYPSIQPQVK